VIYTFYSDVAAKSILDGSKFFIMTENDVF